MTKNQSLRVVWDNNEVGKIALNKAGLCAFEYSKPYLESGISISPFELPLKEGVFQAFPSPFFGNFGVFDDSLPDGWGLLVQDRFLLKNGISPDSLSMLDRLAMVGTTGRGALEFYPDESITSNTNYADLSKLAKEAEIIYSDDSYLGSIEEFQKRGGSPGGARPKIMIIDRDNQEWLVKFRALMDPQNIGETEYKYSLLAKECGVEMPETRLFDGKYFGVKRFDRVNGKKLHTISMAALLRADYRLPSIDYYHIFKAASILSHDVKELWKIYRLMVFNFLIGNKDDHAKNFSFIYREDGWHFAPAYDLLPSHGIRGYHTTSINDSITPTKEDLISVAAKAGLSTKEADEQFDQINHIIASHKQDF